MKTEIKKGQLVGRIDDSYYVCDTIFNYHDGLKGATTTVLRPVSQAEYEERTNLESAIEYFEDCWRGAVKAGTTTKSLESWVENVLTIDGDEAVFDFSGYEYWDMLRETIAELTEENYPVFECIGSGRSFDINMKWDEIYNKGLWEEIKEAERQSRIIQFLLQFHQPLIYILLAASLIAALLQWVMD